MEAIAITSLDDERVAAFARLTEAQLRNRLEPEQGIFIAESPKVIRRALDAGMVPLSFLAEEKNLPEVEAVLPQAERIAGAIRHLGLLCEEMGEGWGVIEARKHIAWYLHGIRGAAALRTRIMRLKTRGEVEEALLEFPVPGGRATI